MPFERARTLLLVGQLRRRRQGEAARPRGAAARPWRPSRTCTPRCGPSGLAASSRGSRTTSPTGLTPTEERVARLAADGLTNREIAERTFLSPKTVEVNLTRIYRKLGVRRAALATRLAEIGDVGRT